MNDCDERLGWGRLGLGGAIAIILGLLAFSETPEERRASAINMALSQVDIAPDRLRRLRDQVDWILRNTVLGEVAHVEQAISLDRLDVVVTDERFADITRTGRANAIYDSSLKAIFIDRYLLQPIDLLYLSTDGPSVMSQESELGFWNTSLSFLIAHELGHHAAHDAASSFFSIDWLERGPSEVEAEIAADAFAINTLALAYADPDMPEYLINENALFFFGLDFNDLSSAERAAGDIIGALKGMTLMMQFSSGPYSPFYQDEAHPSFLERILMAVDRLSLAPDSVVSGQSPILVEETRRQLLAANRRFVEVQAPGPIARVAVEAGNTYVAVRSLIHAEGDEGLDAIYRVDFPESAGKPRFDLLEKEVSPIAEGEDPNTWIEERLFEFAPSSGTLGLASELGTAKEIRLFGSFEQFQADGLAFVGEGWALPGGDPSFVVSRETAEVAVRAHLVAERLELGPPFATDTALIFPVYLPELRSFSTVSVAASMAAGAKRPFFVLYPGQTTAVTEPTIEVRAAPLPFAARFSPEDGWIDVEGARWTGADWVLPGRASGKNEAYSWALYKGAGQDWTTQSRERLLADFIAQTGEASFGRNLDPQGVSLLVLNERAALVWYDQDSVWLSTPETTTPVFHPAEPFLRITRIDDARALFWISNATKAYLINIKD